MTSSTFGAPPKPPWDEVVDSIQYTHPVIPKGTEVRVYPDSWKALWMEALRTPVADSQCQAAVTIVSAHQHGMKGLETTVPALLEALDHVQQHPSVQMAVARALIELDARESAPWLFRLAKTGELELRDLIEPTLARWDYRPTREVWLERLQHADFSDHGLILAARGLSAVHDERAVRGLRDVLLSRDAPAPVLLEASRALGQLCSSGCESDARRLMTDRSTRGIPARLAAANLLRHHESERAKQLLQELARDPEPAVTEAALARLTEIHPPSIVPLLGQLLDSYDPQVRTFAVEVLFRKPSEKHIHLLAERLCDADPHVRKKARRALQELAGKTDHRALVIRLGEEVLAGSDWRGLEQAAILLTEVGDQAAAGRLVELLQFERGEVLVAAAWGLRRLAVPHTLGQALAHFQLMTRRREPAAAGIVKDSGLLKGAPAGVVDQQLSQLAQLFGITRYWPADDGLRKMIPRPLNDPTWPEKVDGETRSASIWALGMIHEGKNVPEIADALEARVKDVWAPLHPPEDPRVRCMSAVTLARMMAKDKLDALRQFYSARRLTLDPVNNACGWAIERLTGEMMPREGMVQVPGVPFKNWLRPLDAEPEPTGKR